MRHCLCCGGRIGKDQPAERVPLGRKGLGSAYRHADYADCSRALNRMGVGNGGGLPLIDEPDYTECEPANQTLLSRHLRTERR